MTDWKAYYREYANKAEPVIDYSNRRRQMEGWWRMLSLAGDLDGARVLDACCGYGELAAIVARHGTGDVHAFDQVPEFGAESPFLDGVDFHVTDLLSAPLEPWAQDGFDLVLCAEAVHYVGVGRALEALWELVRPGGRLIVSTTSHSKSRIAMMGPPGRHMVDVRGLRVAMDRLVEVRSAAVMGLRVADEQTWEVFETLPPERIGDADGFLIAMQRWG